MELYMQNIEHRRMILESVEHGLLIWPTTVENRVTRTKKYAELSHSEKIQADCDLKATNIILQGLPPDFYALVSHHQIAKDLWERIQLLMQVNTKFLNSLPPEWNKFVTNVKLVRDLHTSNFDQLHAYLEQHELHANEVRIMRERNQDPLELVAYHQQTPSQVNTYQTSYNNPQYQQHFSQSQSNTSGIDGITSGQQRVVKYFNYQREGHMARQCPQPKSKRDATWFMDKVLLVEAQGSGKVMNEEELAFLANLGVAEGPVIQTVITHNAAYQADDLDAYDSDCDEFSTAKAVLMANLSRYGLDVLFEAPHFDNTNNDMPNQSVQEMQYSEQTQIVNHPENE
ncbi:hypothetical protein Tco_1139647, partial [Tanacetum coccineum]